MPRPKTYALAFFALTTIGGGILVWSQNQELIRLRLAELPEEERAGWQSRVDALERRRNELEAELASLRANAPASGDDSAGRDKNSTAAVADSPTVRALDKNDDIETLMALSSTPEFQKMLATQQQGLVAGKYAALFKLLKLSPEQQQQLQTMLANKQGTLIDVMLAARAQGITDKNQIRQMLQATALEANNSIKNFLGPSAYGQYQTYERTLSQRSTVDQLATRLSYTSAPLSSKQTEQLVKVLATPEPRQPGVPNVPKPPPPKLSGAAASILSNLGFTTASNTVPITSTTVTRAQTFLSAPQLSALQQMQQEQQAQQLLTKILAGSSKPATTAPPKGKGG